MRIILQSILWSLLVTLSTFAKGSITPAEMQNWKIVCTPTATESEKYAAAEFQRLFEAMTGNEMSLVSASDATTGAIFIGPDAVLASGQPADRREPGREVERVGLSGVGGTLEPPVDLTRLEGCLTGCSGGGLQPD